MRGERSVKKPEAMEGWRGAPAPDRAKEARKGEDSGHGEGGMKEQRRGYIRI